MLVNKSALEIKTGERTYSLECNSDSPLGELYDALCKMQAYIIKRMQDAQPKDTSEIEDVYSKIESIDAV